MSLLVNKRLLTSLNNPKTNKRNRMKYTEVPGLYNQALSRFRLKKEPALVGMFFLHAHKKSPQLRKTIIRSQRVKNC